MSRTNIENAEQAHAHLEAYYAGRLAAGEPWRLRLLETFQSPGSWFFAVSWPEGKRSIARVGPRGAVQAFGFYSAEQWAELVREWHP